MRPYRLVPVVLVVLFLLLFLLRGSAPPATAFALDVHELIVRRALRGQMDDRALDLVIGTFHGAEGSGNHGQDILQGQAHPEYHFDSASGPAAICDLWAAGLNMFVRNAVAKSRPADASNRQLADRDGALDEFGKATHAIADFYSHTNWVELAVERDGRRPGLAPLTGERCDPGAFPAPLQSGFASIESFVASAGTTWCPDALPPPGFRHCHDDLNKDSPDSPQGTRRPRAVDPAFGAEETYHTLARDLAIEATRELWEALRQQIIDRYDSATTDGACLADKLAWGGLEACGKRWRLEGTVRADYALGSERKVTLGTLDLEFAVGVREDDTFVAEGPATLSLEYRFETLGTVCAGRGSEAVTVTLRGRVEGDRFLLFIGAGPMTTAALGTEGPCRNDPRTSTHWPFCAEVATRAGRTVGEAVYVPVPAQDGATLRDVVCRSISACSGLPDGCRYSNGIFDTVSYDLRLTRVPRMRN